MLYSGAQCFIQTLLEISPPLLACTILFLSMFSSISLCTFIRAKFEHLVLAILPVSRTGICWFRQLKRIILASAINLGGAGLRPTAPRSSKNLMGPRPIAPRSQDRPCVCIMYIGKRIVYRPFFIFCSANLRWSLCGKIIRPFMFIDGRLK